MARGDGDERAGCAVGGHLVLPRSDQVEDHDPRAERLDDFRAAPSCAYELESVDGYGDARDQEMKLIDELVRLLRPRLPSAGDDELEAQAVRLYQALCRSREDARVVGRVAELLGIELSALTSQLLS